MKETIQIHENFNINDELFRDKYLKTRERIRLFNALGQQEISNERVFYHRVTTSPSDSHVDVIDPYTHKKNKMIMFGSNNYLGLSNHPYISEYTKKIIDKYGTGIGGAPFLSGYTKVTQELEERIAHIKGQQAAMLYSSGYSANLGLVTGITQPKDIIIFDEYSHASFYDGMLLSRVRFRKFRHNDTEHLRQLLEKHSGSGKNLFVAVEGVYSMDGDIAPLDKIVGLCKTYGATLMIDDAHGTGVLGTHGQGTGAHFNLGGDIDISMGTFSKAIAASGGFVCADQETINFLRYFSRSYMFSSAIGPSTTGAILGALDIMESEPERRTDLFDNVKYAAGKINSLNLGFNIQPETAIIILPTPTDMDIRSATKEFHDKNIFINPVEYPAVPIDQQRFRISMMSTHTKSDIDYLAEIISHVWSRYRSGMHQSYNTNTKENEISIF